MVEHAMLTKLLPVIRGQKHDRIVEQMPTIQFIDQSSYLLVEIGNRTVILLTARLPLRLRRWSGSAGKDRRGYRSPV